MARILHRRTSLATLLMEIRYTLSRLRAHPLSAPHVAAFEELRTECVQVLNEDLALLESQADAQAQVDVANETIDDVATRFHRCLLNITRDNRNHPTYVYYFGNKTLYEFKRPVLAGQLREMARWIPSLASADPSLQAMAPELTAAVEAGEQAVRAKEDVARQRREHRELGSRRRLADRLNAARKEIHGALGRLPHEHPNLPTSFADQFFRRDAGRPEPEDVEGEELETIEAVCARIEALQAELGEAEERLEELEAEARAEEQAARERAEQEALVAEIDRAVTELQTKRAAMMARLRTN